MERAIETTLEEFKQDLLAQDNHKRLYSIDQSKSINAIVGMRRTGKTKFLHQVARQFLDQGVPIDRLFYLNFEDDRLFPFINSMRQLIDAWYELYPEHQNERCYLFLDGVEKCEVWPLVLRKILDVRNVEVFISGTSAKLFQSDIAAPLRGRTHLIEILPYSYEEFLLAGQLDLPKLPGKKAMDRHRQCFTSFLSAGEITHLQSAVERMIFRDMVERHQVGNVALLKTFIHFLTESATLPFSINKFYHDIKSQGVKVAKDTLHAYLSYLEEAFFLFAVPIFTESESKRETTPKKIYLGDTRLITAHTFKRPVLAKLFENQVYLDLRRKQKSVFYYPTKHGDVFVALDSNGGQEIIQADWDNESGKALEIAQRDLGLPARQISFKTYLEAL